MPPLYFFKIDEETGEITREVINEYHTKHPSEYFPNRVNYYYRDKSGYSHDVRGENIDKFVNWRIHSFNEDIENAKQITLANLRERYKQAIKDTKRFATVIDKLGGFNGENKQ